MKTSVKCICIISISLIISCCFSLYIASGACGYVTAHYFFCEVGSKACITYMEATSEYFANSDTITKKTGERYCVENNKKWPMGKMSLGKISTKVINSEDFSYPEEDECDNNPRLGKCYHGEDKSFYIHARKIRNPEELKNLSWILGVGAEDIFPEWKWEDPYPDVEEEELQKIRTPVNSKEVYMIGIIHQNDGDVEAKEILQKFYDKLQESKILFRGQALITKMDCYNPGKASELPTERKKWLGMKKSEILESEGLKKPGNR